MQQIYRRTPMPKWSNFIEITLRHGCSPVNLLHIFRISVFKSTSGWLLLSWIISLYFSKTSSNSLSFLNWFCNHLELLTFFFGKYWLSSFHGSPDMQIQLFTISWILNEKIYVTWFWQHNQFPIWRKCK